MLAKLVVAFRAKLSLFLDIVFSLGDRRVLGNIGQISAQNAAIHLHPTGAVGTRAAVSFSVQIDNIICHVQPHFSLGVGAGEGVAISSRLQNTVTRVLPLLVQV